MPSGGRAVHQSMIDDMRLFQLRLFDHGFSPILLNATITGPRSCFKLTPERCLEDVPAPDAVARPCPSVA